MWRDSDGLIDYGSGPRALALRGIAMAQLGELERAKALLRRALRGFEEERVDRSTLSPKDALNDNVEHAVPGCLVGLRRKCARKRPMRRMCGSCALSALCAVCVEVAP